MNKYEFLSRLRNALSSVPREERDSAMSYYEEFFSDAGEDNEQAVIASLGSPEELAKSIINENENNFAETENVSETASTGGFTAPPTAGQQAKKWTGGQIALVVVLAILSVPIWGSVLAGIFAAIVGIFAAMIGVVAACGGGAIGFLVCGILALFHDTASGLMMLGASFILIGLFPLVIIPMCKLFIKLIGICIKGIGALINKITGRREAVK